ncbi:MAG: redoxin family protein [Halieaceae bacterium]|jgi:methylamine dehydrogenase accessory protein MauD|nr:redoxin family protein [Halieaceae bacterium]
MNEFALLSIVALWICVVGLAVVVAALVRQVGVLSERVSPAGALAIRNPLKVGDEAPRLTVQEASTSAALSIGGAHGGGRSTLLFWVSPDCPMCKKLLPAFKSAAKAESAWLDVMLATDADSGELARFREEQRLQSYPMVNSRELGTAYGVSKLPYAALIDAQGRVAALGLVNTREHFDSLFNAKEANVASIQEYLGRKPQRGQAAGGQS